MWPDRAGAAGRTRGYVDDAAPSPGPHAGQYRLGAQKHRFQIHSDGPVEIVLGEIVDPAGDGNPGIVDENVDRPEFSLRPLDETSDRIGLRNIGSNRNRAPAGFVDASR